MRVTREKAIENRERILASAARLFREKGFDGVGVDAIMEDAGLTHGGFYRHFRSKEDLAAEAVASGFAVNAAEQKACATFAELVATYLSPAHRDDPGGGCALAALGSDIARQGPKVRRCMTDHVRQSVERLAGRRASAGRRQQALASLSGLVGALVLARAVDDPALSDEILAAARAVLGARGAPRRMSSGAPGRARQRR